MCPNCCTEYQRYDRRYRLLLERLGVCLECGEDLHEKVLALVRRDSGLCWGLKVRAPRTLPLP